MTTVDLKKLQTLLAGTSPDERRALAQQLRQEFPLHVLEQSWNTTAEVILEAIARSGDLTQRGVRGVIAESSFKTHVVDSLTSKGWQEKKIVGEQPYDFLIGDAAGDVRIQVKMQRRKEQRPMLAVEANKGMFPRATEMWVVETQRTRGGKDNQGKATRPYKFGEFDIIAVCLHPSTNDWSSFRYTVANWFIPERRNKGIIFKYQPVPKTPNDDWTDDFLKCISWFRVGQKKRIKSVP
jgi:hypothetical protein